MYDWIFIIIIALTANLNELYRKNSIMKLKAEKLRKRLSTIEKGKDVVGI